MKRIIQRFKELVRRVLKSEERDDPEVEMDFDDVGDSAEFGSAMYDPHR